MGKFKVGDKVSVHIAEGWVNGIVLGESCSGLYLTKVPDGHGWSVNRNEAKYCAEECGIILETGRRCYWNADEFDIKPLKPTEGYAKRPKRRVVIEITDDGAEAKYVIGKKVAKTASVKRYKDDKPDDRLAAHYVVGKLFGQKVTKNNVDMDALKNAKYDCMIARYHLNEISKVLDPFGEPDFGKVDFRKVDFKF